MTYTEDGQFTDDLERALRFVAHNHERLCRGSDYWHSIAHGFGVDAEARERLVGAIIRAMDERSTLDE